MDLEPGTVVAHRYRISRAIGRGGMGEVFAAENIRTGRPVAVKLLRADSKSKSSAVERFRREARAAGSINSDHVTQVLDVEDDAEHGIVIVFELLEGESLIDRLKRTGPIPFDELHPIIEEVWVGLSDAHKVGIIHRDLKPSNVFLERRPDGQQRVKILDFGISKLPKEMGAETLTEMGQSLGTFSFMPPEQIGRAKTVDHRADIYATTTMIYQSLTGQLPYIARNILVMVELKSKTDPRPLAEALGHPVDRELEEFVAKGLARNPADRFQDALRALEEWRKLKHVDVPPSRRAVSSIDLGSHARASAPPAPLPAAGRSPTGAYQPVPSAARPRATTPYPPTAAVPSSGMAPAPVVPAAMLEPVLPGALPRLYDPTESTTDISHVDAVKPVSSEASGVKSTAAATGQRADDPLSDEERKGPQGTRVLPPQAVQQAISAAAAKKAQRESSAGGPHASAQQPSSQHPRPMTPPAQVHSPSGAYAPVPHSGAVPTPSSLSGPHPASSGGPLPTSGSQPRLRSPTPDPRALAAVQAQQPPPQPSQGPGSNDMRQGSQPPQSPHGPSAQAQSYPGHIQRTTMRLPEDPSSGAGSADQTQVYRPKKNAPQHLPKKKQSVAVYVLGALAFAVVGFGIVYAVQLIVRQLGAP